MKRKNVTRNSLITSIISMLLCVSMLVGATFAWFTDEVKTGMNTIAAGNLDVELLADGVEVDAATKLFDNVARWEPGVVVYENLQVANVGSLALRYQLSLNFGGENDLNGHKLSEVLKIAVIDKISATATREEVLAAAKASAKVGALADFYITGELEANTNSAEQTFVIFWEPSTPEVDNLYNVNNNQTTSDGKDLHIEFGVNLQATQKMSESDSFNNEYDKNAWSDAMKVYSALDLQAAINAGESAILLMADIEATEAIEIPAGATVALNLNGKTLTAAASSAMVVNNGTLTVMGGTIENTAVNGGATINNKGTLVLEDGANIVGAPIASDAGNPAYCITNAGNMTIEKGASVSADRGCLFLSGTGATVINGGTLTNNDIAPKLNRSFTSHVVVVGYGANNKLTINDGEFKHLHTTTSGGVVINNWSAVTVDVNGGNFSGGNYFGKWDNLSDYGYGSTSTPFSVTGGTFTGLDDNYVASGYVAVDNGDGTYTVVPEVPGQTLSAVPGLPGVYTTGAKTYHVFDKTGLKSLNALFAQIAPNEGNINTVNLGADVDLAGETWEPLNAMWITFNGNNHTISNLTAGMAADGRRSGFWAYAGAVTINDLTLENVTVSGSQAGTFAGAAEGAKLNNCVLKGTNTVNYVEDIETWCGIGAISGVTTESTLNVEIASGATVTLNRGKMITAVGCVYVDDLTGHIQANKGTVTNNGTVTANGSIQYSVSNAAELASAVASGLTDIYLVDGEYDMPNLGAVNGLKLVGQSRDGVVVKLYNTPSGGDFCLANATATLENMTFVTEIKDWAGFQNATNLTFNKCDFINNLFLSGNATFNECHFTVETNHYNVWAYSANSRSYTAEFNYCVFDCAGKSIYIDGNAGGTTNMIFNGCAFNDNDGGATDKAAIETGTTYGAGATYNVTITDCEFNGFATGKNTDSNIWANKNSMGADKLNIVIDGVDIY